MRNLLKLAAIAAIAIPVATFAAPLTIKNSKHDLSSGSLAVVKSAGANATDQICIFCHVPHNALSTRTLWNRANPSTTYDWNGATAGNYLSSSGTILPTTFAPEGSGRCLSCHDGSIGLGDVHRAGGANNVVFTIGAVADRVAANKLEALGSFDVGVGGDMQLNHPVGIRLPAVDAARPTTAYYYLGQAAGACVTSTGSCTTEATNGLKIPLYGTGAAATVECASCHEPHDGQYGSFLRISNAGSALCLACHKK